MWFEIQSQNAMLYFEYSRTSCKRTPSGPEKCLLKRGVHLREVKNVVFVCGWDHA